MKSPLKSKPLRNPGESVDRKLQDVVFDDVLPYVAVAILLVILAGVEWFRSVIDAPPAPWTYSIVALLAVALAIRQVRKSKQKIESLKLGRDGEKAVGQYIERLRGIGAEVFHDVPAERFNVDHVVIHETGIYVIETKTLSKPDRGEASLVYDGENVLKNGLASDRNAVHQVRAEKAWLADLVKESTGKSFPVRAVVLYPGWYIVPTAQAKSSDVWVLNPKALPAFIEASAARMSKEDVKLCAFHLGRYVRTAK